MAISIQISRAEPSHSQIEKRLSQQIESGELQPGERLPNGLDLARMCGVSCTAVQKALANLTRAGLVVRSPRRGTFVKGATDRAVIGLLFGPSLTHETGYFYRALLNAFRSETQTRRWACRSYDGLNQRISDQPHRDHAYHNLKRDLDHYGFKGLIHIHGETEWSKALEKECRLSVARWGANVGEADAAFDRYRFTRDSVAYLAGQGRRKLALVRTPWHREECSPDLDGLLDEVRAQGLAQPEIVQVLRTGMGPGQEAQIQEAMARAIREWQARPAGLPDGLIVDDDVSMRSVALALLAAGVKVPDQLNVVTFASEGVQLHYGLPVVRYEFPTSEIARVLVGLLEKRMAGETLPSLPIKIKGQIKESGIESANAVS